MRLTRGGSRPLKQLFFLIVGNAIQGDCAWARIYQRLVRTLCAYDERTHAYRGKRKIMGRIAGQIISTIYALLKRDAEMLARAAPGSALSEPSLYDPAVHKAHCDGNYCASKLHGHPHGTLIALPHPEC